MRAAEPVHRLKGRTTDRQPERCGLPSNRLLHAIVDTLERSVGVHFDRAYPVSYDVVGGTVRLIRAYIQHGVDNEFMYDVGEGFPDTAACDRGLWSPTQPMPDSRPTIDEPARGDHGSSSCSR